MQVAADKKNLKTYYTQSYLGQRMKEGTRKSLQIRKLKRKILGVIRATSYAGNLQ